MSNLYQDYWDAHARKVGHRTAVTGLSEHDYRELYLDVFRQLAPPKVERMLDYGCGPALLLPIVRELWPGVAYDGVDISEEMISFCIHSVHGAHFWKLPLEGVLFKHTQEYYDFLTCHSVFTHIALDDAVKLMRELHRLLIHGGHATISIHDAPVNPDNNFEGDIRRVDYNRRFFQGMLVQAGFSIEKRYEDSRNSGQCYFGVKKI